MPHAAQNVRPVLLDPHTTAAAIPFLSPPKLAVQKRLVHRHARGQPAHHRHQALPVTLPSSRKSQHLSRLSALSAQTEIVTTPGMSLGGRHVRIAPAIKLPDLAVDYIQRNNFRIRISAFADKGKAMP